MIDKHLNELRQDVPPMPDTYMRCIDNTIKEIENMHMDKRMKYPVALVALLLAAVVMSGIALAAVKSNLTERLFHYQAKPNDLDLPIERDLAAHELDGLKLSIDEAIYDGSTVRLHWTMNSTIEGPVYVGYVFDIQAGQMRPEIDEGTPEVEEHVLRMLDGAPAEGYMDIYLDEPDAGRPIDIRIAAHVFTSPLDPVPEQKEDFEENNAFYYAPEEAERREAAGVIVVNEDGYANITRYPSYGKGVEALDEWAGEFYVERVLRAYEESGLMVKMTELEVKATLEADQELPQGSYVLAAPQVIARGDEILTVTRADFTPASTRIEFTALVPAAFYDPEINDWHGSFEYPLMLTNGARDPLMMDLGVGWDGYEQEDGNYLIEGFMYGRPMADLEQDFYLVVADPDSPIKKLTGTGMAEKPVSELYRDAVTTDDPERILKLELVREE